MNDIDDLEASMEKVSGGLEMRLLQGKKSLSLPLFEQQTAQERFVVPGYGQAGYSDRLSYITKVISFKTGKRLRWVRDGQIVLEKAGTFTDLKHREQLAEWRRRQQYYETHGRAPGPTIIKLKSFRAKI